MSIPSVVPSHVFGISSHVHNPITYIDDQIILYPAGTQLVSYNTEQKTQKFLHVTDGEGITAMAVSSSASLVAVAVRCASGTPPTAGGDTRPSVFGGGNMEREAAVLVYDFVNGRKKKVLVAGDPNAKEFMALAFSPDSKHIIAQSSFPDWILYIWDWDKAKLRGTYKTVSSPHADIRHLSVNPFEHAGTQVCVTGNCVFRTLKHGEGGWKVVWSQKTDKNLLCHTYLSETRILAGTQDSKLLLYDSGDLILEIAYLLPHATLLPSITTLKSTSNGVLAGTSNGVLVYFEKEDSGLVKRRETVVEDGVGVVWVATSVSEDVAVVVSGSQVFVVGLEVETDNAKCTYLTHPFHHGSITGMDTCIRKPLLATCGTDRSVRIWNYLDNSLEVFKYFLDEPLSVALHPSGLYVLVGFTDGLKLMNVLIDDIRQYWEAPVRGCRECHFSHGGQYFAAVHGSTILIYNTWTLDIITHLKGHNGKIRSIAWSPDDTRILSCGMDGVVYDWDVRGSKKMGEVRVQGVVFLGAVVTPDAKLVYCVGGDGVLREVSDGHVSREFSTKVPLANILVSRNGKMAFATTPRTLRTLKYPFPQDAPIDYTDQTLHSAPITRLRISYDDQHLFTCGEDGLVWVFRVVERERKREKEWGFSDEILVTKSDLKDNFKLQSELKRRVEDLRAENETQLRVKDLNYGHRLTELEEKYRAEIETLKNAITTLHTEHTQNLAHHANLLNTARTTNTAELASLQTSFSTKLDDVTSKYNALQTRTRQMEVQWEEQMKGMGSEYEERVEEVKRFFGERIKEKVQVIEQLKATSQTALQTHEATLTDLSTETTTEILHLSTHYEHLLSIERQSLASIRAENASMHAKFMALTRGVEEQKMELAKRVNEERRLGGIIKSLERDIGGIRREIQERDDTIQDKSKRIYDLKKKNQELEKFKFVLDYKMAELFKQVEPREDDIVSLSTTIKDMDTELEAYHETHDKLLRSLKQVRMRVRAVENERKKEGTLRGFWEGILERVRKEVGELYHVVEDVPALKRTLLKTHQTSLPTTPPHTPPTPEKNTPPTTITQRDHLERTLTTLQTRLTKQTEKRIQEYMDLTQQQAMLVSELNVLRKEVRNSEGRVGVLERKRNLTYPMIRQR
ncbi:uncharacterized protein SPPG_02436 [Spizellomyces punctatus DAOM BR117]|uniref:Uncharacterized protein n=1 Tax=Spizellomyces punctatus (strain DAOM BR117) TaxID=645134 RepID=A0A0L0HM86_SPIPD|nr:uncharacterized protein SPPG_02436 [Spizellomyces punctatus DAOM BR117]KND01929.1 hypothetical protein SPPG_02436 [Spizellomyces punctatus DAOM BR117]|eukprot:XP_016609968.1 hypothetical protein SPPG_02436 [Spizellomyces punctatus DAOM BR117]